MSGSGSGLKKPSGSGSGSGFSLSGNRVSGLKNVGSRNACLKLAYLNITIIKHTREN